jgi:hypothetical protein
MSFVERFHQQMYFGEFRREIETKKAGSKYSSEAGRISRHGPQPHTFDT